ncbi:DUF4910 domain-containing protein [Aquabacter sp. CN5-332]|uniref:DUF4910 domain-containing protein n=1 Tax=Aquabacter sp. CN5-332 TaxID=3156608 RepID=UPI0032B5D5E6
MDQISTQPMAMTGQDILALVRDLFPICRSLTGDGVRRTLARLAEICPLEVTETASGTPVFDWVVPPEWNVRGATIRTAAGETVVDFADSNLHLVSYSTPVRQRMSLTALRPHLHSLPEKPGLIPYRTAYYKPDWGFCLEHRRLAALAEGEYDVEIDTTLAPGHLTYGECFIPGASDEEILISAHVCHPSLANDNLSSVTVAAFLGRALAGRRLRHGCRILFVPSTIGTLTWLARNEARLGRIKAGLVLSCIGDAHAFQYKRTVGGAALIDRVMGIVFRDHHQDASIIDFFPYGYDERQYNAPGFRLPVGNLCRSTWGEFPQYHTSADNPQLLSAEALEGSLDLLLQVIETIEADRTYVNLSPKGEPQLGRRGLYGAIGGAQSPRDFQLALLWLLNQSDGTRSLLDIAERSDMPFALLAQAAEALEENGLIAAVEADQGDRQRHASD